MLESGCTKIQRNVHTLAKELVTKLLQFGGMAFLLHSNVLELKSEVLRKMEELLGSYLKQHEKLTEAVIRHQEEMEQTILLVG
jgi:hypothetical protein